MDQIVFLIIFGSLCVLFAPDIFQFISELVLRLASYEYLQETAEFGNYNEPLNNQARELLRRNEYGG